MDTPRTATITMRVRNALKKRLEKMARSTGRSRSFLATANSLPIGKIAYGKAGVVFGGAR